MHGKVILCQNRVEKRKESFLVFNICCSMHGTVFSSAYVSYTYLTKYGIEYVSKGKIEIPKEEQIEIEIPEGYGTADVAALLEKEGLVEYPWLFRFLSN